MTMPFERTSRANIDESTSFRGNNAHSSASRARTSATSQPSDSLQLSPRTGTGGATVSGLTGRVFNRILGVEESRTDTGSMTFGVKQVAEYLDKSLQLCIRESFRTAKVKGVAKKLVASLDSDGDGRVTWLEFQAFQTDLLSKVASGLGGEPSARDVVAAAEGQFARFDADGRNGISYDELNSGVRRDLPEGTRHASVASQAIARLGIDVADTNQRDLPVSERSITKEEWTAAALALAGY